MINTLALATAAAIGTNLAGWHKDEQHVERTPNIYAVFSVAEQKIVIGTQRRNNAWFGWRGESDRMSVGSFGIKAAVTIGATVERVAVYEEIVRDYEYYRRSMLSVRSQPLRRTRPMQLTGHKFVTEPLVLLSAGVEVSKDWTVWVSKSDSVYVSLEWSMK